MPPPAAHMLALLVVASAGAFFGLMYDAITGLPFFFFGGAPGAAWSPALQTDPCGPSPAQPKNTSAFMNHMFYMSLAFGLFAPVGAVAFTVCRDVLGGQALQ